MRDRRAAVSFGVFFFFHAQNTWRCVVPGVVVWVERVGGKQRWRWWVFAIIAGQLCYQT
jgi:hypothetical protein